MTTINDVLHKAWRDCAELGILLDRVDFRAVHTNIGTLGNPDLIDTQVTGIDVSGKAVKGFKVTESASHHVSSANGFNTGCDTPRTVPETAADYDAEIRDLNEELEAYQRSVKNLYDNYVKECADTVEYREKYESTLKCLSDSELRVVELEDMLRSARNIARRKGAKTAWDLFDKDIDALGIGWVTANVYVSEGDHDA